MAAPDRGEIRRACALLFEPGDVVELRALEAVSPSWRRPHTVAGYFADPEKLADAAVRLRARGVYVTLNRLRPELLARARDRVKDLGAGDPTTSDGDVTARRWLPIDCDPVRPAGISASETEHDLALDRARAIRDHLAGLGWPDPILADSGNGGHLLYRVDLAVADQGLVGHALSALAFLFDDETVTVDQAVANPARIWKLYGTVARKGEDDPARPHRSARILEAPDGLTPVSPALLQALAGIVPVEPRSAQRAAPFDLPRWLSEHTVPVEGPRPWSSGERWIFPVCPWHPDHRRSAYIVRFPSGAVAAGCHHNSCRGNDWHALRSLYEPGWRRGGPGAAERRGGAGDGPPAAEEAPSPRAELPASGAALLAELQGWPAAADRAARDALEARALALLDRTAGLSHGDLLRAAHLLRGRGCRGEFTRGWVAAALAAGRRQAAPASEHIPYTTDGRRLYLLAEDGARGAVVADFAARIAEEARGEDGAAWFALDGCTAEGDPFRLEIAAEEFADDRLLKAALTRAAGARATVRAGRLPHLRPAIQLLSGDVRRLRRYERTGWVEDAAGRWRFLIPGREPEGTVVRLPRRLPYRLDPAAELDQGLPALAAALEALDPRRTTVVAAALFEAPLARPAGWLDERYALLIAGRSGNLKTTLLQTLLCCFGAGFLQDELLLKLGEGATRNAILRYAAQAHDLALPIDNYKPNTGDGSGGLVSLVHNLMEGGDRERLSREAELREGRPIRCFPIFTGEDVPAGDAAGLARLLVVPFAWSPGPDGENARLAEAQRLARHLPAVGRAWIAWLEADAGQAAAAAAARRFPEERRRWLGVLCAAGRQMVNPARVAANLATNALTWQVLAEHPELGPLAARYAAAHAEGLAAIAADMAGRTAGALEATRFLEALRGLLATGRCCLVPRDSGALPRGERVIGWADGAGGAYLEPALARHAVEEVLGGDGLGRISSAALYAQLDALGLIASHDPGRLTRKLRAGPVTANTLHLAAAALAPADAGEGPAP